MTKLERLQVERAVLLLASRAASDEREAILEVLSEALSNLAPLMVSADYARGMEHAIKVIQARGGNRPGTTTPAADMGVPFAEPHVWKFGEPVSLKEGESVTVEYDGAAGEFRVMAEEQARQPLTLPAEVRAMTAGCDCSRSPTPEEVEAVFGPRPENPFYAKGK